MGFVQPLYSRSAIDAAGHTYVLPPSPEAREQALAIINNWRSAHSYPLNTWQTNLRRTIPKFDTEPTVAQRIKRLPSIRQKLERFPDMKLSRMQDLGGCRAVVADVATLNAVVDHYVSSSRAKHRLIRQDYYVLDPPSSGYRGTHLVYAYNSDRNTHWNGLRIEMQIRSQLQHGWATAVETVGTFTKQALKSSQGADVWLRFFALMSSALAIREGTPCVPGTPENPADLGKELRKSVKKLDVVDRLQAYGTALRHAEQQASEYKGQTFLMELDIADKTLSLKSYNDVAVAADQYSALERATEGDPTKDVVLVSVDSLAALRRAYPNYFLDTSAFVASVREAIQ